VIRVQCSAAHDSISGNRVYPSRVHTLARTHANIRDSTAKNLASLKASYSFTASLRSTSLLKLSKNIMPRQETVLAITFTSILETRREKILRIGSLSMPSESLTTSLRSANSPVFIKKYYKRANCLLSRSCHHCLVGAIIIIRTRECMHAGMRAHASARARVRRGCLLHLRVNVQAARVTSSLLALVCQVTRDRYCKLPTRSS
jgi:hypothetical protein